MNKKSLFLIGLLLASVFIVFGSETQAAYPSTINKADTHYGYLSGSDITFLNSHFDLVMQDIEDESSAASLTSTVLGYKDLAYSRNTMGDWATCLAHPSWFVKTSGGDYIYNSYWGTYLMNISNAGWQQHFIDFCNSKTGFDGVFVDDVWNDITPYLSGFNGTVPAGYVSAYHTNMETCLTHLQTDISISVVINSDEFSTDTYLALVDGQCLEGFIHPNWEPYNYYDSTHGGLGTALARKGATGKLIYCMSGISDYTNNGNVNTVLTQCYNDFVGNMTAGNCFFEFGTILNGDNSKGYYSLMDTPLSSPTPTPTPSPTPPPGSNPTYSYSLTASQAVDLDITSMNGTFTYNLWCTSYATTGYMRLNSSNGAYLLLTYIGHSADPRNTINYYWRNSTGSVSSGTLCTSYYFSGSSGDLWYAVLGHISVDYYAYGSGSTHSFYSSDSDFNFNHIKIWNDAGSAGSFTASFTTGNQGWPFNVSPTPTPTPTSLPAPPPITIHPVLPTPTATTTFSISFDFAGVFRYIVYGIIVAGFIAFLVCVAYAKKKQDGK